MILVLENDFENHNFAIVGGAIDNLGERYETNFSCTYYVLYAQPEIQILN